jgi:hypothetical protein
LSDPIGTMHCPICAKKEPHPHSSEEINKHQTDMETYDSYGLPRPFFIDCSVCGKTNWVSLGVGNPPYGEDNPYKCFDCKWRKRGPSHEG